MGNPCRTALEDCLAALDNAKHASCFSSGLGALSAITSLLRPDDHLLYGDNVYGGTHRLFQDCLSKQAIRVSYRDQCDTDDFIEAIQSNTKVQNNACLSMKRFLNFT